MDRGHAAGYQQPAGAGGDVEIVAVADVSEARRVQVVTQEVVEIKNGKKVTVERKLIPATCWSRWT
jgi:hypothetical protein